MKKRILSLCMVLALCLSLLPATALAADGDTVYVGGVALTGSTGSPAYATTDTSGNVSSGGNESSYNIKWDGSTLILKDAYITNEAHNDSYSHPVEGAAIGVANSSGDAKLTIQLEGGNTIEDVSIGIYVYARSDSTGNASLTIEDGGSLTASGSSSGILVQSNSGNATLTIQDADVEATMTSASGYGVNMKSENGSSASLIVDGGSLTASGSPGILYDSSGSSSVPNTALTISNSALVDARDGGIGAGSTTNLQPVTPSGNGIVFDDNQGAVCGDVTLQEDLTIGEGESLDIPSGASLEIPNNVTLTNEGTVTNSGTLTNNGTINNSGTLPDNIQGTAPPSITTTSLDGGTVGTAYSATLTATGNPTLWTWSASTGSALPNGLTLDESTGVISGTPTTQGTSNFTVMATNSGGSDSEQLSITIDTQTNVPVTGVLLNTNTLNLIEGDTDTLTATVEPNNATDQNVTWSSDNESVATVNNGVVTAHSAGNATITVTSVDGNKTATCAVTVTAKTYNISANPATLDFGSVNAGYMVAPAEQTVTITNRGNQSVTLNQPTAENYEIGALTATTLAPSATATFTLQPKANLSVGTYSETITISGSDGASTSLTASFTVSAIPVTSVSLNTSTLSLTEGDTDSLTATVEPDNATNKNVTWSSDNPSVATVNNGVVTAHSAGNANITVATVDQNKTATCAVTVTARTYNISASPATLDFGSVNAGYMAAPAEQTVTITNGGNQNVTLNQPTAENYEIGSLPTTTLIPDATATFTVQPKARLEIGTYNETIVISGSDGAGTSLTVSFTVSAIPVTGVSLNTGTLSLTEGGTDTLSATVEPDNATNQNVTWSSDDESVATVNDGVVTAVAAGTATITVTTEDGNKTATCAVTVVHGSLTHTQKKDATCTEDGNEEYWTCETCGKHFRDAEGKVEIPLSDTVVAAKGHNYVNGKCSVCDAPEPGFKPIITAGAGGTWQKGSRDGLSFTSNAAFADFVKVQIDGRDLAASDYEVREGSTIVTLKASYLETLSVGKHTLAIVSDTGTAATKFTIRAAVAGNDTRSVQTGDSSNIALWITLLLISGGAGIALYAGYVKRRKN